MSWAAAEFKTADLGGKRLNKRLVLLAERLGERPTSSLPGACNGWGATQAAYLCTTPETVTLRVVFPRSIGISAVSLAIPTRVDAIIAALELVRL